MPKPAPLPNAAGQIDVWHSASHSSLGIRHYLVISASSLVIRALALAIRAYQLAVSPAQTYLFGAPGGCRYTPSCSAYAIDALRAHGVVHGTTLAARRVCRCHPWGGCGHDPVPPKKESAGTSVPKFI